MTYFLYPSDFTKTHLVLDLGYTSEKSEEIQNSSDSLFPALPSEREQLTRLEQSTIFTILQSVIDEVLKTGGNEKNSALRILAKYRHGKPHDENISFLKREYRSGGKGLILDGQKVSAWWDTDNGVSDGANTLMKRLIAPPPFPARCPKSPERILSGARCPAKYTFLPRLCHCRREPALPL